MSIFYINKFSKHKAEKLYIVNNMDEKGSVFSVVYRFCDRDQLYVCSLENFNKWFEEVLEYKTKDGFTISEGDYYYYYLGCMGTIKRDKPERSKAEFISNNGYKILENLKNTLRFDFQQEAVDKINKINNVVFTID